MRLRRNCWNAWTVVVPPELVAVVAVDVLDVDAVLLVSEVAPVAAVVVPTPIDCSAWRIEAISPPPSGDWPAASVALLLDVVPWF